MVGASTGFQRIVETMGTVMTIDVPAHEPAVHDAVAMERVVDVAVDRLRGIEERFSTYDARSEVSCFGRGELREDEVSDELRAILDLAATLRDVTGGSFDVHAAAVDPPAAELQRSDLPGARPLEPSGLVKGWAIEQVVDHLRSAGLRHFAVNIGGDVYAGGEELPGRRWRIGVQHPVQRQHLMAVLHVSDMAVATSGTYERGQHIVDPRGGRPKGLLSVTVVGPDVTLADVYATAIFARGRDGMEWATTLPGFDVLMVDDAQVTHFTPGLAAYIEGDAVDP